MSSMEIEEAGPPPTVANKVYQCGKLTGAKVKSLKSVMFKDPNGFFELNRGALEHFVDWPDLKSYAEVTSGIRRFRISLIGIEASVSGSIGSPVIAKRRETARALVKSLYLANFNAAPADAAAIDTAVNSCQTLALLVSRGKAPRSITRRRNQPANSIQSIFDLVDDDVKGGSSLECIGAITVSVCTNFQFVHWLAVSSTHTKGSQFQSWRHRGVGSYLLHATIARSVLPSVKAPTRFLLQCLDDNGEHSATSPLRFYRRLGFIVHRQDDNGWSMVKDDNLFKELHRASPSFWVPPKETEGMCLLELPHGALTQRALRVDESTPDRPSNVYATFPIDRELHKLEGLVDGLHVMKALGQPLYDTNSSIEKRQCVHVVRNKGDTSLVSGTVARDWRTEYDTSDGNSSTMWMSSGGLALLLAWTVRNRDLYRSHVLIIPPDVALTIYLGWTAFNVIMVTDKANNEDAYAKAEAIWLAQESLLLNYINREKDLFERKFIFLVNNHSNVHWSVTAAIHPGQVDKVDGTSLCGMLHMDSMPGKLSAICGKQPDPKFGFRFFLNYAYSVLVKSPTYSEDPNVNVVQASPDVIPFKEPFGPSLRDGFTSAFPQIVFAQPAIVLQRDDVNCALGVVINVALVLGRMLNLQLTRAGEGVVDKGTQLILDEFYAPIRELQDLRPDCVCEMYRRDMEVFLDRLALLTHQPQNTLAVDIDTFRSMRKELTPIFHVRAGLYQGIEGAPKPLLSSFDLSSCGGGNNCAFPGKPTPEPYDVCIACQARMHVGCAFPTKEGSLHGICATCHDKKVGPAKTKGAATKKSNEVKEKQKRLPALVTQEPDAKKDTPKKKRQKKKDGDDPTTDTDDEDVGGVSKAKGTKASTVKSGKKASSQEPAKKKAKASYKAKDNESDEEQEFDHTQKEEPVKPDEPPPLLHTLSRREFQAQQGSLKTVGGMERFIEARQTLAESQEHVASEKDLDAYIAASFKREKFYTDAQFEAYEANMHDIIASCQRDRRRAGVVDAAFNRGFLIAARRQRKEMRAQFTQEWMRTCEGVIRGLRYMPRQEKFRARVIYYSFRKKEKQTMTVDVTRDWMELHFGVESTQYIIDCAYQEKDGFVHVLKPAILEAGTKTAMLKVRFVTETTNRRSSPRKPRKHQPEPDSGYWEGVDADGVAHRLADNVVAPEVKTFYKNRDKTVEESDGSFVVLQDDIPRPTIMVDDSPPVVSVSFVPERTKQVKASTQLDASERFLRYGKELGKVLDKTRQQTHDKMKDGKGSVAAGLVADFGYDEITYEERVMPEIWRVRLSNKSTVPVTRERVVDLFGEGFAVEVQKRGTNGHKSKTPYIDVPVGACRIPRLAYFPSLMRDNAPEVRFLQGAHDTCIYSAFASALHFVGARLAANQIRNAAITDAGSDPATVLGRLASRIARSEVRFLQQRKIPKTLNFLTDLDDSMILVGSLVASDGSVNHAVAITRGWVFDSNEHRALPLTKAALDVCTQSEDEAAISGVTSTFSHFGHGKIYEDKTKKQLLAAMFEK